jgi:hypothetical protein
MPSPPRPQKQHTIAETQRVLDAYDGGGSWRQVAEYNGIPSSTAYRLARMGSTVNKPCSGARAANVKCTVDVLETLEGYLNENCDYALEDLKWFLLFDLGVDISTSTISRRLIGMLYTVNQVCNLVR